jgi:predicted ester cyclase
MRLEMPDDIGEEYYIRCRDSPALHHQALYIAVKERSAAAVRGTFDDYYPGAFHGLPSTGLLEIITK